MEAGVDVRKLLQTSVLIKCGRIEHKELAAHIISPLLRSLGAVGVGQIHLCGAADYYDELEGIMAKYNFIQHPGVWLSCQTAQVPRCNIIIDLSNNLKSQLLCSQLSRQYHVPSLFVMWNSNWVAMASRPLTKADLPESPDGGSNWHNYPPITRIASGLALHEVIRLASDTELMVKMKQVVLFNAAAKDRKSKKTSFDWQPTKIENAVIELVGAGAIGVNHVECLVPLLGSSSELRIFDSDTIGPENLASQIAYNSDDVGQPKAVVVAEKLRALGHPKLKITPLQIPYQQRPEYLSKACLRILCPDNLRLRLYANSLSLADGVPIADAGSSVYAAQTRCYVPRKTACLEHRIQNLAQKVANEQQPASCTESTALTMPPTTMVIGGILADEALKVLSPGKFGSPSRGTITYDSRVPARFGIVNFRPPCNHNLRMK
jgi:molybdopterin/thiamine biosynthesis adenylyltransferase